MASMDGDQDGTAKAPPPEPSRRAALAVELRRLGADLRRANRRRSIVIGTAKSRAREAHALGFTEVELARLLGVDRAKTVRRWLGKVG